MSSRLQITKAGITGCCIGGNFYNLGGAHGRTRAKTVEEFADRIISLTPSTINIAVTNNGQKTERIYLEKIGFREVHKQSGLWLHAASHRDLEVGLAPYKASRAARYEQERQKRLEQERARAEQDRVRREQMRAKGTKRATAANLRNFISRLPQNLSNTERKVAVQQHYGVQGLPVYDYSLARKADHWWGWTDDCSRIVRAINYRVFK